MRTENNSSRGRLLGIYNRICGLMDKGRFLHAPRLGDENMRKRIVALTGYGSSTVSNQFNSNLSDWPPSLMVFLAYILLSRDHEALDEIEMMAGRCAINLDELASNVGSHIKGLAGAVSILGGMIEEYSALRENPDPKQAAEFIHQGHAAMAAIYRDCASLMPAEEGEADEKG